MDKQPAVPEVQPDPPPDADADPETEGERGLTGPRLTEMRRAGLTYAGGAVVHLPGSHRALPDRDLPGPEAAALIPNRKTLLWVLGTKAYTLTPAPPEVPHHD